MARIQYAQFMKRFSALIIDGFIVMVLYQISAPLLELLGIQPVIVNLILSWLYFALMESSTKRASIGKQLLHISVCDINGSRISFGKATARYFAKFLSGMSIVGYLMPLFSENRQALHDVIIGTIVINDVPIKVINSIQPPRSRQNDGAISGNPSVYGIYGEHAGKSAIISGRGIVFGRDSNSCQIVFSSNTQGVSRRHCFLNYNTSNRTFELTDIGSSYGTYLESGMKLVKDKMVRLRSGERFYLGSRNNLFEVR